MGLATKFKQQFIRYLDPLAHRYVPRGVIFLLDTLIALLSAKAAFVLVASLVDGIPLHLFKVAWPFWAIVMVQVGFIAIFKSYAGLIRYSSLCDAVKQLKVVALAVLTLLVINQIYAVVFGEEFMMSGGLIIYGVIAFSLLFLFRIIVKNIYEFKNKQNSSYNAFILGVSREEAALAAGLMAQHVTKFAMAGFIDDHENPVNNKIHGLPIFNIKKFKEQQAKKADTVIVREEKLKALQRAKTTILSELVDLNIKIYKLPKPQNLQKVSDKELGGLKEINIEDLLPRSPIKLDTKTLFSTYEDKTVIVTGAAGSIGSEIVRQLILFKPKKILLVDQAETPLHELSLELKERYPHTNFEKIIANVRNRNCMTQIFDRFCPQIVFHAAAYKHVPMMESNALEALSVNFQGTRHMTELAIANNVERFIFVSTDKAVNPTNIMGASKRAAELYIQYLSHQSTATSFITTRFGNVLGSNGSVVPYFKKQIAANGPVTVTHPEITRYFMTIDEACQLVLQAGGMGKGGEIFVFDMGHPVKIFDLAKKMIRLSGLQPGKDIAIEFIGLRPGEKLYEEVLADKERTTTTLHEKILIGQATCNSEDNKLIFLCNALLDAIEMYDSNTGLKLLKSLVPEYHPENTYKETKAIIG